MAVENQELSLQEELRTGGSEGVNMIPPGLSLAIQQIQASSLDVVRASLTSPFNFDSRKFSRVSSFFLKALTVRILFELDGGV